MTLSIVFAGSFFLWEFSDFRLIIYIINQWTQSQKLLQINYLLNVIDSVLYVIAQWFRVSCKWKASGNQIDSVQQSKQYML